MQEIVFLLSSIAGAATAIAVRKFPRNSTTKFPNIGTNPHVRNQINSLKIEKDILTKTITRLYHQNPEITKIQRDKLLARYQHQLSVVSARIEKLNAMRNRPDLGVVGDSLITLMDQKLSRLDKRLVELSSKIDESKTPVLKTKEKFGGEITFAKKHTPVISDSKKIEKIIEEFRTNPIKKQEHKIEPFPEIEFTKLKPHTSFEITTLTEIPTDTLSHIPESQFKIKKQEPKMEIIKEIEEPKEKIEIIQSNMGLDIIEQETNPQKLNPELSKQEVLPKLSNEKPESRVNVLEEDNIDDDDDDLDKIKVEIMKTLSKLEQAEVE